MFEFWFQILYKTCTVPFVRGSHRLRLHLCLLHCYWSHFWNHRCIWIRFFLSLYYTVFRFELFFFENVPESKLLDNLTTEYDFFMAKSWNFWYLFLHFILGNGKLWKISKNAKNLEFFEIFFWIFLEKFFPSKTLF